MQSVWAKFAKNPHRGPGWNPVGTGTTGSVLVGAYAQQVGGVYRDGSADANVLAGSWNLGLLGNRGDAMASGVTVVSQHEADYRCGLFAPYFQALLEAGLLG